MKARSSDAATTIWISFNRDEIENLQWALVNAINRADRRDLPKLRQALKEIDRRLDTARKELTRSPF